MTVIEAMTETIQIKLELLEKLSQKEIMISPTLREIYKRRIAAIDVMLVSRGLAL